MLCNGSRTRVHFFAPISPANSPTRIASENPRLLSCKRSPGSAEAAILSSEYNQNESVSPSNRISRSRIASTLICAAQEPPAFDRHEIRSELGGVKYTSELSGSFLSTTSSVLGSTAWPDE